MSHHADWLFFTKMYNNLFALTISNFDFSHCQYHKNFQLYISNCLVTHNAITCTVEIYMCFNYVK